MKNFFKKNWAKLLLGALTILAFILGKHCGEKGKDDGVLVVIAPVDINKEMTEDA